MMNFAQRINQTMSDKLMAAASRMETLDILAVQDAVDGFLDGNTCFVVALQAKNDWGNTLYQPVSAREAVSRQARLGQTLFLAAKLSSPFTQSWALFHSPLWLQVARIIIDAVNQQSENQFSIQSEAA
jgi:hypothetical protein